MRYNLIYILFTLCILNISFTQFEIVKSDSDLRRLKKHKYYILENFDANVQKYFTNHQFSKEYSDVDIILEVKWIVESISSSKNENIINAQAVLTNNSDQYFFDKKIEFKYLKGQNISRATFFDSIGSILEFYANLFIGLEADTYNHMGGESYYDNAIQISSEGILNDYDGWENRQKKVKLLKNNNYYRQIRFYFYEALDNYSSENYNNSKLIESMSNFMESLKNIDSIMGLDRNTQLFLDKNLNLICEFLLESNLKYEIYYLINYDSQNKHLYNKFLNE